MQPLKKVHINSSSSEVSSLAKEIVDHYHNAGLAEVPYLPALIGELSQMQQELVRAIKRIKTKSDLKQADASRDKALKALFHFTNGQQYHYADEIKQAARQVNKILRNYGPAITRESYDIESSLVSSLLQDLHKPDLQAAINRLSGCSELIVLLDEQEQAFIKAQATFTMTRIEEKKTPSASLLRNRLIQYLNSHLLVFLRAMYLVDEPLYGNFARVVAVAIAENNRNVKRRQGKRKKKQATSEGQ